VASFLSGNPGLLAQNLTACTLHGMVWIVSAKMSVFLVTVLSVARTISMVFPLRIISNKYIAISVFTFLVMMLVQNSVPFWFGKHYVYWKKLNVCVWNAEVLPSDVGPVFREIFRHFLHTFQFTFPTVVVIVCSCISLGRLTRPMKSASDGSQRKRRASITMLYITTAFLIFNLPFVTSTVIYVFEISTKKPLLSLHMNAEDSHLLMNIMYHTHYFNSIANAVIYIFRLKGLRNFVSGVFQKLRCRPAALNSVRPAAQYSVR
jgi:hypothetical protein